MNDMSYVNSRQLYDSCKMTWSHMPITKALPLMSHQKFRQSQYSAGVNTTKLCFHCLNVSTTPIVVIKYRRCLSLSVVQLKGKHRRKPHCSNGVVDKLKDLENRVHKCALEH